MPATAEIYAPIASPPLVRRPYGLFSVAPPAGGDGRWEFGVSFEPSVGCLEAGTWQDACINGATAVDKTLTPWACDTLTADSFTVYVYSQRSAVDNELADAAASGQLEATEEYAVETHLWEQLDAEATDLGPQPGLAYTLAVVEGNLAAGYRGRGVIHLSPFAATRLADYLEPTGGALYTKACGTPVVVGAGYGDPDSPTVEIVGTGGLFIRRGELSVLTAWNRSINDIHALAERTYLTAWDCFAAKATVEEAP